MGIQTNILTWNKISHDSIDHVIVPDTVKVIFNIDTESADNTRIINNAGSTLVKKIPVILGLKEISMINNLDIYQTYADFLFNWKTSEEKLLQGIHTKSLIVRASAKRQMEWQ